MRYDTVRYPFDIAGFVPTLGPRGKYYGIAVEYKFHTAITKAMQLRERVTSDITLRRRIAREAAIPAPSVHSFSDHGGINVAY